MSRPDSELAHLFRQLKAPAAACALPKLADRARQEQWSYEKFAATLLKTETDSRDSHVAKQQRGNADDNVRRSARSSNAGMTVRRSRRVTAPPRAPWEQGR